MKKGSKTKCWAERNKGRLHLVLKRKFGRGVLHDALALFGMLAASFAMQMHGSAPPGGLIRLGEGLVGGTRRGSDS